MSTDISEDDLNRADAMAASVNHQNNINFKKRHFPAGTSG